MHKTPGCAGGLATGADDEIRTRDIDLGKVALYQLSYIRSALNVRGTDVTRPDRGPDAEG